MKSNFTWLLKSFVFLILLLPTFLFAQIANVEVNSVSSTPWTTSKFANISVSKTGNWVNVPRVIDASTTNSTYSTIVFKGKSSLRVTDAVNDYPGGTYVGFKIDITNFLTGNDITIRTYLNGVKKQEVGINNKSGLIDFEGKYIAGFTTDSDKNFDAVEIEYAMKGLGSTINVFYPVLNRIVSGKDLDCNQPTKLQSPAYAAVINEVNTGLSGLNVGGVGNAKNVIDNDNNNYATLTNVASIAGSTFLAVKDISRSYEAGTFAGFEVENANFIAANIVNNLMIKTFYKGVEREKKMGSALLVNVPVIDYNNRNVFGFETTQEFDEVQIIANQPIGLTLGTTKVFNLVLKKPCEGTALACNTSTSMLESKFPVNINSARTGITGVASLVSRVNEPDNVTDDNTSNYATLSVPITVGTSARLSVLKSLSDFPAGTYAGFDIQNVSFLNVELLKNITLTTFKDGVLQEVVTDNLTFIGIGSDFIASDGRGVIGFVTKKSFDELQISVNSLVGINLGVTKVFRMVATQLCPKKINCNSSYYLTQPEFPVVLNMKKTGLITLACVGCSINNADNIIDDNKNNFSRITLAVGVGNRAAISVLDPTATYPKGTYAGFTVKDRYFIAQGDLLEFITVKTYLKGKLQESKTSFDLFDISLIIPIWGTGTKNVGFKTTKDFDEVQLETISIASVINILDVYGVFIDTRSSDGTGLSCAAIIKANDDAQTIVAGSTASTSVLDNDTFNGGAVTTANVIVSQVATTNPGVTLDPTTGFISVAKGTPAGVYQVTYNICDKEDVGNCSTAIVTVTVLKAIEPNMVVTASVKAANYSLFSPLETYYTVKNIGDDVSDGKILLTVTVSNVPNFCTPVVALGWVAKSLGGGAYSFETDNIFNPGEETTLTLTFTAVGTIAGVNAAKFDAKLTPGSGRETKIDDNSATQTIFKL